MGINFLTENDFFQEKYNHYIKNHDAILIERLLFPRSKKNISLEELEKAQLELYSSIDVISYITFLFSLIVTDFITQRLQIKADGLVGYSAGECNALISTTILESKEKIQFHPIDKNLIYPFEIARKEWNYPPDKEIDWGSYYLFINNNNVYNLIQNYDKVYLTHINSEKEIIISGSKSQCVKLINDIQCDYFESTLHFIIHCSLVRVNNKYHEILRYLDNTIPLYTDTGKIKSLENRHEIVTYLSNSLTRTVNFKDIVYQSYHDNCKIYIEIGPGSSCTRMVDDNLYNKEHLSLSFNKRGVEDKVSLIKIISTLLSHKVSLNTDFLLLNDAIIEKNSNQSIKILVGGKSIKNLLEDINEEISNLPNQISDVLLIYEERNKYHLNWLEFEKSQLNLMSLSFPINKIAFNKSDVMEFTEGKLINVFGSQFSEVDSYACRLRLPSPPFMALSRVIEMNATPLSLEPGRIITEFDLSEHSWCAVDGQIPIMSIDAQGILFLLSYTGVDLIGKGSWVYRWLNSEITFFNDMPKLEDTLRYDITISSFVKNEDALLCFSHFNCTVNNKLILKINNTCAGFFTKEALEKGKGLGSNNDITDNFIKKNKDIPLLISQKQCFSSIDLKFLQEGKISSCFGDHYDQRDLNKSLRLAPGPMLMLDRIHSIKSEGGVYGLGYVIAEKDLHPNDWYMRNHFKDAPVFAGPCMMQAATDLLQFISLYFGLQTLVFDARFQMSNQPFKAVFRKQVSSLNGIFSFRADIKSIHLEPSPALFADIYLIFSNEIIGKFDNMGIQLKEKSL